MSAQHTPGPWRLYQGPLLYVEADGHLGPIAELRSRLDVGYLHPLVAETREANARLIAAAPDLLEACKLIVSAFDALAPASAARNEPMQINAARAAIAKATREAKCKSPT